MSPNAWDRSAFPRGGQEKPPSGTYDAVVTGAVCGWNRTVDDSGRRRFPRKTPIRNLSLSGAWAFPGHGCGAWIPGGLSCFGRVMTDWNG